ncbi:tyrosine--tRNA ligase [Candidatus Kaiserbacteria bacterium]|nr:tyrosine--tRNA ligase [Candidatus Kaiserbacteria bacterium]
MKVNTDSQKIEELLTRGVVETIHRDSLQSKLKNGSQLRVKLGIDPTSPDLHLGRAIPLLKLRDFQELGHQIVLIVGDFTGIIGDTSDKESERPMLTHEVIEHNMETYKEQAGKLLDMEKVEFHHNSEWLEKLTYREIGEHANLFSVADFIARDNIKRRLDAGTRVSLREVLYPLMQGYDSVAVCADVELGGTDQRFNLLAGRALQPHYDQEPQNIVMTTLINGTDGRKMSSSWGNTITLTMSADDMYGKIMSMNDTEIVPYFTLCTRVPLSKIADTEATLLADGNPRDIKMGLAREIVGMYHGVEAARAAEEVFVATFQQGGIPEDLVEIVAPYTETLVAAGVVTSKSELRRLFDAGGIRNAETGEKYTEFPKSLDAPLVLKVGKRRFVKLLP